MKTITEKIIYVSKKIARWGFIYVTIIVYGNFLGWMIIGFFNQQIYEQGTVVRLKWVAFVFCHGGWYENNDFVIHHSVDINNKKNIPTDSLITQLVAEGVRYIWLGTCRAADHPFMRFDRITREKTVWPPYVSRGNPGINVPIWIGPWFIHFNLDTTKTEINDTSRVVFKPVVIKIYPSAQEKRNTVIASAELSEFIRTMSKGQAFKGIPDSITFIDISAHIPRVLLKDCINNIQPISFFQSCVESKASTMKALGWKRGVSFPITILIQPIIIP